MADVIAVGTPLTRLRAEMERKLAERDQTIAELRIALEDARSANAAMRGINDLLRLQLADLARVLDAMQKQIGDASANVTELRAKLPDSIMP